MIISLSFYLIFGILALIAFKSKAEYELFLTRIEKGIAMSKMFLIVVLALISSLSFSQTRSGKTSRPVKETVEKRALSPATTTTPVATSTPTPEAPKPRKSLGGRISQNLRINYWSAYTGPGLDKMDYHQVNIKGEKIPDPHYLWNQISFNYNFGWKLNWVVNPRFSTQFGSTHDFKASEDPNNSYDSGFVFLEDALTGLQGVVYSKGKFSYWARYAVRLSTSLYSQKTHIAYQPEIVNDFNYAITPRLQIGAYQQLRFWRYESVRYQKDARSWRAYHAPYVYYSISDFLRIDAYYNNTLDHRGGKNINYLRRGDFTNFEIGPNMNFTPNVSIWPYIQVSDRDNLWKTAQLGAWISVSDI